MLEYMHLSNIWITESFEVSHDDAITLSEIRTTRWPSVKIDFIAKHLLDNQARSIAGVISSKDGKYYCRGLLGILRLKKADETFCRYGQVLKQLADENHFLDYVFIRKWIEEFETYHPELSEKVVYHSEDFDGKELPFEINEYIKWVNSLANINESSETLLKYRKEILSVLLSGIGLKNIPVYDLGINGDNEQDSKRKTVERCRSRGIELFLKEKQT